jgi:hypothetical protein
MVSRRTKLRQSLKFHSLPSGSCPKLSRHWPILYCQALLHWIQTTKLHLLLRSGLRKRYEKAFGSCPCSAIVRAACPTKVCQAKERGPGAARYIFLAAPQYCFPKVFSNQMNVESKLSNQWILVLSFAMWNYEWICVHWISECYEMERKTLHTRAVSLGAGSARSEGLQPCFVSVSMLCTNLNMAGPGRTRTAPKALYLRYSRIKVHIQNPDGRM